MFHFFDRKFPAFCYRLICASVAFSFFLSVITPPGHAQNIITQLNLPMPGAILNTTPAYEPAIVKGITIFPDNPLKFSFIIDTGDETLNGERLGEESLLLIKYFMAALTVPEKEMWVTH